jgi:general stress protein YciG
MTLQSPRIYIYKITFEEVSYYYYGVKKEEYYNQEYWGSPYTNKWCWKLYTPKKQILQFFPYTDKGWLEAQEVEKRLIRPVYNTDKWCLNESCGGVFSIAMRKKTGQKVYEDGKGLFSLTPKEKIEVARKGGQKTYEKRIGIFSLTDDERKELGRKNGKITYENKTGIHSLSIEEKRKLGEQTSSQKWQCTETGFITNAGNLTKYQKKRSIDTSKRIRIL